MQTNSKAILHNTCRSKLYLHEYRTAPPPHTTQSPLVPCTLPLPTQRYTPMHFRPLPPFPYFGSPLMLPARSFVIKPASMVSTHTTSRLLAKRARAGLSLCVCVCVCVCARAHTHSQDNKNMSQQTHNQRSPHSISSYHKLAIVNPQTG